MQLFKKKTPEQPTALAPKKDEQTVFQKIAKKEYSTKKVKGRFSDIFLKVSLQDRVLFARHLSVGLKAGMTMQKSLQMISDQAKSKTFKKILKTLKDDTTNGMFLADSMSKYKGVFGELFINIIRVGENSGTLIDNLNYLGVELKKKKALKSKVRGAMIYPLIIMIATVGIVATLMIGVFPKILPVFSGLSIELPLTTRILIAVSAFMSAYTFWLIAALFAIIIAMWWMSHYEWYKRIWHRTILRLPVIGKISVKVNSANLSRILGLLLNSGVQAIEAVNITSAAMDNRIYKQELAKAGEGLRRGEFLSKYMKEQKRLFPTTLTNMIEVGETTGNLTENLQYLSEFYEGEVDDVLKNLSSIIEPILLLFMGLLVGFIALSVITPIYRISQTLTL
ncbi:MAG: type II secretion system F family protein [Candidatus Paceibacterota bacterium]